jgi:hypothetical protein
MHPSGEMSSPGAASAFSPVLKSPPPADELSSAELSPDCEDDFMPISAAVRICPEISSAQASFKRSLISNVFAIINTMQN